MVQLVDPATRLRLDVFPGAVAILERAAAVDIAGVPIRVPGAADVLDHKIQLLAEAGDQTPVDEKHHADARRLGAICRRDIRRLPATQLASTSFSRDVGAKCSRCEVSKRTAFPLAPKEAIFEILGYV